MPSLAKSASRRKSVSTKTSRAETDEPAIIAQPPQHIVPWKKPPTLSAGVREYPADKNPVLVYLATLASGESRRTMTKMLIVFMGVFTTRPAAVITRGASEAKNSRAARLRKVANEKKLLTFDWHSLRYQHVMLAKTKLIEQKSAPPSVNLVLNAVRGVAREAMRLEYIRHEDYERIRDVKGIKATRLPSGRHVDGEEIDALFGACDGSTEIDVRNRALLAFARTTGCRRSEIVGVDAVHIDRKTYAVSIVGKGNKQRLVYAEKAKEPIYAWLMLRGMQHGPLFCAIRKREKNKDGSFKPAKLTYKRMGATSVAYILKDMAEKAEVMKLSPHDMRRTFIGDLLDAGADISIAQRLAGHASVVTTQRYDRRPERVARTAAALIDIPPMPIV